MSERSVLRRVAVPTAVVALLGGAAAVVACDRQPNAPRQFTADLTMPDCQLNVNNTLLPESTQAANRDLQREICQRAGHLVRNLIDTANGSANPYLISESVDPASPKDYTVQLFDRQGTSYTVNYRNQNGHPDPNGFQSLSIQRDKGNGMGEIITIGHFTNWSVKDETYVTNRFDTDQTGGIVFDYYPSPQNTVAQNAGQLNQVIDVLTSIDRPVSA